MDPTATALPHHGRLIGKLLLLVAGAFLFAFALVPLYNVLCDVTGFNGKTAGPGRDGFGPGGLAASSTTPPQVDASRSIRVEFTGTVMPGLPWDMRPLTLSLDVHPGDMQQVIYLVRNTSDHPITGQAVPSISPGLAARHFEKIECFCFAQQSLGPGEAREMPVAFVIKPDIDPEISQLTLSYAFFSTAGQRQTLTRKGDAP